MTDFLHLIIAIYEKFYLLMATGLGSYGLAIIALSILTSLLMLRPVRWANKIAGKEQEFQAVLGPQLERIRAQSAGAEQHARINALYRRYGYHPIYAVRKILGLFIQLPFLVLTYFMFKGLAALNGESFLFISNLGAPDALILHVVGNFLPFLMTAINLVAAVLMPNLSRKDLTQAIVISLLFFIILYNSMAALLLYWTTNNLITLLRNIIAYSKADKSQRIDFKLVWQKTLLFILRKEVASFVIIFFVYAVFFKLFFLLDSTIA